MSKVRILVVDDHHIVRLGLSVLLASEADFSVIGQASSGQEALVMAKELHPDVILLDIRLAGNDDGIDVCRQINQRWPEMQVVILTSYADDDLVLDAFLAGAAGYVLKQVQDDSLVHTIRAAARGDAVLDPPLMRRLVARVRQADIQAKAYAFKELSQREREVLALIARGKTNSEIADILSLSEKTVGNHVGSILAKLNLTNRVQAATFAVRNHIERYVEIAGTNDS